jgi:Peptidase S24-like
MKIQIFRVAGRSMEPEFREGDFVMISKLPFRPKYVRPGTPIAFIHSKYGMLIKKVQEYNPVLKQLWATGISRFSIHRDEIGPIPVKNVIGEVIGHVRKIRKK